MTQEHQEISISELTSTHNYEIDSLESEIKADRYCTLLLKQFHRWLLEEQKNEALEAGQLAAGADYFLREFLIGSRRQNIFKATATQLRQFGGNWYIISNLEPNLAELEVMLRGAAQFFVYGSTLNLISAEVTSDFQTTASDTDYFRTRIEEFHQLQNDGYRAWDQACPLR